MKFAKSLRFKLTLWYSFLVLVFCMVFLVGVNFVVYKYMTNIETDVSGEIRIINPWIRNSVEDFTNRLDQEERELFLETRDEDVKNIRIISFYSLIPLTLLSFLSGYFISGQMLKPLKDLSSEMENLSTKSLGKQIKYEDTGDEISSLIRNFNKMSERLGLSFKSQKEFVENASHELKTPLSVIQSNLDLALEDGKISKKELKEILDESRTSVKYMSKLTEDLLLLSALENDIEKEETDTVQILRNCCKNLKTLAEEKGFKVKITGKKLLVIDGNDILLSRAFSNIMENSIKYSQGSEIEVNVRKENDKKIIEFKDNGNGVPEKDVEKIFDRFYRVDKSRSRKTGGSGIGLSITKKIVEVHNGRIYAENIKNGFRVVMEF
jgi:two-component system sensor histidine kinase ArlS